MSDTEPAERLMCTGHRRILHSDLVARRLRHVLDRVAPEMAVCGGAQGADTIFARCALGLGVPLEVILPNRWYRSRYPDAVPDDVLERAHAVRTAVGRPDVADWRAAWDDGRWWLDNHTRNRVLVAESTLTVIVSDRHPCRLLREPRGGTASCLRDIRSQRGAGHRVIWVPDDPCAGVVWVALQPG